MDGEAVLAVICETTRKSLRPNSDLLSNLRRNNHVTIEATNTKDELRGNTGCSILVF